MERPAASMIGQAPEPPLPGPETPGHSLKGETTVIEPSRPEQAIARRSAEVRATVPDLELSVTVAAESALRRAQEAGTGVSAIVLAALASALRTSPRANGAYRDGHYELYSRINIGVMLTGPQAPASATLFDADRRTPAELHRELIRLRARALSGELTSPEQAGATFTFTDLSEHGIDRGVPLVVTPQAAALSAGAVREVAVVRPHGVQAGHVMTLTVACDHRILFGDAAASFLASVARELRGVTDPGTDAT